MVPRLAVLAAAVLAVSARAEHDSFLVGEGATTLTISTTGAVLNDYAQVSAPVSVADRTISVSNASVNSAAGFAAGRLVMLLQTTGSTLPLASGNQAAVDISGDLVGRFELARIASVTPSATAPASLTFTAPLTASYPALVTQVVLVPEYDALTISTGASVVAQDYSATNHTGGVVALLVRNTLALHGAIDASGNGHRGGAASNDSSGAFTCTSLDQADPLGAGKGQTIALPAAGRTTGYGNVGSGGGGGNCHNAGGGGGGHGGGGGNGGRAYIGDYDSSADAGRDVGGRGGAALSYAPSSRLAFGGGGGGGQGNGGVATAGGRGGGLVWVRAGSLAGTGVMRSNGVGAAQAGNDGAGGGGAGGAIYARFINGASCGSAGLAARGGGGGTLNAVEHGPGGGGAGGVVLLQGASPLSCTADVRGGDAGTSLSGTYWARPGAPGRSVVQTTGISTPPASAVTAPDAGALLNNSRPTLSGTGPAGARTAVLVDNVEVGRPTIAGGNWTHSLTTALTEGSHTVVAKTEADGLFHPGSAPVTFTVDTVPPDTSINSGPANNSFSGASTAVFQFSSADSSATFECRQNSDAGVYSSCASSFSVGPLQDGPHRFEVRATDPAGNVDPTPAVRNWTVDTVPPDTAFDAGPPPLLNLRAAAFQISSTEPGVTILCKLDSAPTFTACSPSPTFTVASDGAHVLLAQAQDRASNVDPTPAAYSWMVDTMAPDAGFAGSPPPVTGTVAFFSFTASEPGCSFQTNLDLAGFMDAGTQLMLSALSLGTHQLEVRATDPAGNLGAPASITWMVAPDADGDGLSDTEEGTLGTDPLDADTDQDQLGDGMEVRRHRTDPRDDDSDDDGLIDGSEVERTRTDPLGADSDGDGLTDGLEVGLAAPEGRHTAGALFRADADTASTTDPGRADSDGDGLRDGAEDENADGARQSEETDPTLADTDADNLSDGVEVNGQNPTDPTRGDSDGDGLPDGVEDRNRDGSRTPDETDPNAADTDQGGVHDGVEVRAGTNPLTPIDDVVLGGGGLCGCGAASGAPWALVALALGWGLRRRAVRAMRLAALPAVLLAAGAAMPARAQSLDVQRFKPAPGAGAVLDLHGARALGHLQVEVGLAVTYANAPLVLRAPLSGTRTAVVFNQTTADVLAAVGFLDWLELGLAFPVTYQGSSPAPILGEAYASGVAPAGIGDLRVVPKATLLNLAGLRVGLAATVTVPTGSGQALMGQGGVGARPRLLLEYELEGRARFALNAGVNLRQPAQLLNLTVSSELAAAAAAEVSLAESLSISAGLSGAYGLEDSRPEARPLELLSEVRYALGNGMSTSFGAGLGLTHGYGTPLFRVMAGFSFTQAIPGTSAASTPDAFSRSGASDGPAAHTASRPAVPCRTADSLREDLPLCSEVAPAPPSPPPAAPPPPPPPPAEVAAAKPEEPARTTAPAPAASPPASPPPAPAKPPPPPADDADRDGVADELDLCPDDPGPGDPDGCPPDDDRDGIPNYRDKCPTAPETLNGRDDEDGCPEKGGKAASKKRKRGSRRR